MGIIIYLKQYKNKGRYFPCLTHRIISEWPRTLYTKMLSHQYVLLYLQLQRRAGWEDRGCPELQAVPLGNFRAYVANTHVQEDPRQTPWLKERIQ